MKFKVGETTDEIEVGQYKAINKGALRGAFTLVEYPSGRKTVDCKYFVKGDGKWFSMPQREVKYTDGRKTDYFPYITYLNKEYFGELQKAVLAALKQYDNEDSNGEENTYKVPQDSFQDDSSAVWFG